MTRPLRILYVAYPLLPVSEESCGGAEQVLCAVELGIKARGHATTVAACAGSQVAGEFVATCSSSDALDIFEAQNARHTAAVVALIRKCQNDSESFDLVHDHSGHFWKHANEIDVPVLATLHLPRNYYETEGFANLPSKVFFSCVSQCQARSFADLPTTRSVVENGINLERFAFQEQKGDYLLWLGRICEEKAPHLAIEVAQRCGLPLVLAGRVYPFSYHEEYFQREIAPQVDGRNVRLLNALTLAEKIALLQGARAVLIPSQVDETSSLVAMEAMACGTPVIAFGRGALPEVVKDHETGFIVETVEQMADALDRVSEIDPFNCRKRAKKMYSVERMCADYERLYQELIKAHRTTLNPAAA